MKHVIRKPYWNYEKEEAWINKKAAQGLALTDYTWCRYVFEDAPEGEYIYRIELLEHYATHPESQKYIAFVEETGVEYVASYMRWVYFRKKASDGPFDIFSDIDSKIKHYKKVLTLWGVLALAEFTIGISNISISTQTGTNFNLIAGLALIGLGLLFTFIAFPIYKKKRKLIKEKEIRE